METSGLRRMVSPAGFASAAEASSARPRKAPPMPSDRAPGLPKLNCNPESDSMSVFCAASGAAVNMAMATTRTELRMLPPTDGVRKKNSASGSRLLHLIDDAGHDFLRRPELFCAVLAPAPLDLPLGQA